MRHRHRLRTRMATAATTHAYATRDTRGQRCSVCDRPLPSERCGADLSVGSHPGVLARIVGEVVGMCLSMTAGFAKGPSVMVMRYDRRSCGSLDGPMYWRD